MSRVRVPIALASAAIVAACSFAPGDARIGIDAPRYDSFPPVADMMDLRCGSLDCHGNRQRNLIVYGCEGLREDSELSPVCGRGTETTDGEYRATYDSLIALEPAVMSTVVANHGENPALLTFVRKARGEEAHKGGSPIHAGDASDQCIARWLAGASPDDSAYQAICTAALGVQ